MQLFTIGLLELENDGTPLFSQNSTLSTYDSQDIISFARAWTGFARQTKRANIESMGLVNRLDPMRINPLLRDRFPKPDLSGGFIGDKVRSTFVDYQLLVH